MIARSKNKGMGGISRLGSLKREKGAAVDDKSKTSTDTAHF